MEPKLHFVRAEHNKTGEIKQGKVKVFDIGNVIKVFGRHGWIVTKHYEVLNGKD